MPDSKHNHPTNSYIRHRDRVTQMPIYFGKLLRSFVYQSDWKMLPMCAIISALVAMVIRREFCVTMEGTLLGSFAITCAAIWNGSFNSIQSICRERSIIKREHRSGMHISAYICAHMLYQALLCLVQSILMIYIFKIIHVRLPEEGLFTRFYMVDITATIFLITYAADMTSLFISSIAHSTTGAMTVMPFLLIFQLVFSGGVFNLPTWAKPLTNFTISNYGLKCVAAQSNINDKPLVTAWNTMMNLKDREFEQTVTSGQIFHVLQDDDIGVISRIRSKNVSEIFQDLGVIEGAEMTPEEIEALTEASAAEESAGKALLDTLLGFPVISEEQDFPSITDTAEPSAAETENAAPDAEAGTAAAETAAEAAEPVTEAADAAAGPAKDYSTFDSPAAPGPVELDSIPAEDINVGNLIDAASERISHDLNFRFRFSIRDLLQIAGEEEIKNLVEKETAPANYKTDYAFDKHHVFKYWIYLAGFSLLFAGLAVISLEFIDKDKR